MTSIAWLTDIHLNFLDADAQQRFLGELRNCPADAILLGGDIGEAPDVCDYLRQLNEALARPIYFVLGNHDFYRGSIQTVRRDVTDLAQQTPRLHYLSVGESVELAPGVGLVGHDGWADGRVGDYERSLIMLNDYRLIEELAQFNKRKRLTKLHALGDEAAEHIRRVLPPALHRWPHVFLLTHVPPMREACWHEGRLSDDEWAPHFACQAMGSAILDIMADQSDKRLTVLCGHTHGTGECQPAPNVTILTGGAEYGQPKVQRTFEL